MNNNQINRGEETKRVVRGITLLGMGVNLILSIFKFVIGIFSSSQGLVADGVHSLSDMTTDIAILLGVKFWSAPADQKHPYGHWRIESLITVFIGIILFIVAVGIGYHSVSGVRTEQIAPPGISALIVAIFSIVLKEILYRYTASTGKKIKSSSLIANAWHHRTDALSSVPVAIAVFIAKINPEWAFVDRIGAVIVSVFILHASYKIISNSLSELLDAGVCENTVEQIKEMTLSIGNIKSVHAIRTRRVGPGVYVDLHVLVDGNMSVYDGHEISTKVKKHLIENGPDITDVIVHLEPS